MDLLKTPHQLLLEESGAHIDGRGLLMTPKQMLFQESGVVPKFAKGKKVLSPEDMKAKINVQKTSTPKFAAGGQTTDLYTNPELAKAWNNFFR
jgi:hypothetical protein